MLGQVRSKGYSHCPFEHMVSVVDINILCILDMSTLR